MTPLTSTLKLAQGTIGAKGNTSCVWTNSKITTISPNLPLQCKCTTLKHGRGRNDNVQDIASMQFEHQKIIDLLHLLQQTEGIWGEITIGSENAQVRQIPHTKQMFFISHHSHSTVFFCLFRLGQKVAMCTA